MVGVTFAALHGLVEDTQYVRPQHNAVVALTENPSDALKDVGIVDRACRVGQIKGF